MTRDEANRLIKSFASHHGGTVSELNMQNMTGLSVGGADLFFTFHQSFFSSKEPQLEVSALIYRFRKEPNPAILEGFKAEHAAGTPAAGGELDYEPENKGLYLTRFYGTVPSETAFHTEVDALAEASKRWSHEVLERVANKVNAEK